jgi:hypothetical protein
LYHGCKCPVPNAGFTRRREKIYRQHPRWGWGSQRPLLTCSAILWDTLPPMLETPAIGRKGGWQQDRSCGGVRGLQVLKLARQTHVRQRCQLPSRCRYEAPCALQVSSPQIRVWRASRGYRVGLVHGYRSLFHGHGHTSWPLFHGWWTSMPIWLMFSGSGFLRSNVNFVPIALAI